MKEPDPGPISPPGDRTVGDLPVRIGGDGRVATWNPGLVRASRVILRVRTADGEVIERSSMNSGRARVRDGETIVSVRAEGTEGN